MANLERERPLVEGWKEIAKYFDRSPRAVQTWEKEGLRVHRFQNRVWAYIDELEQFKADRIIPPESDADRANANGGFQLEQTDSEPVPSLRAPSKHRSVLFIAAILAVAGIAWGFALLVPSHRQPVKYHVDGNILRTFDAQGKRVWEFTLPGTANPGLNVEDESHYPKGMFVDLNDDGNAVFLLNYSPKEADRGDLYCFGPDGKVLWIRHAGRDVTTQAGSVILDHYWTNGLGVLHRPRPDGGRIVVASHHAFSWTSHVAVLTAQGKPVAEYWHPGWIFQMAIADLDGDGVDEIILGGVNHGFQSQGYGATLVVLDSRFATGQGPVLEDDRHQIKDVPAGREAAVLLFPEFKHGPGEVDPHCRVGDLIATAGHLEAVVWEGTREHPYVHYQLDQHLHVASITPSIYYDNQFLAGLSPAERQERIESTLGRVKVLKNRFAEER
jgi:hypothetical protein